MSIVSARGHQYSFRNWLLIQYQSMLKNQEIEGVFKGFWQWNNEDNYQILKGQKGYKVFAPAKTGNKTKQASEQQFTLDEEEEEKKEEKKAKFYYILVSTFDVSQTSGYEEYKKQKKQLNDLACSSEFDYAIAKKIIASSPELKLVENNEQKVGSNGSYEIETKTITINMKITPSAGRTAIHEFGHSLTYNAKFGEVLNELLAELVSFFIHKQYNVAFNYTYSNIWLTNLSKQLTLSEFEKLYKFAEEKVSKINLGGI
jgi:hypothetical protein